MAISDFAAGPIGAGEALTAIPLDAGLVPVAAPLRGRPRDVWSDQHPDWVRTVITEAVDLQWVPDDPDGLRVHAVTPGGRRYRITAN